MGWTGTQTDRPSHEVVREEIEYGGGYVVVARRGRYYAVKRLADGEVFGVVALTQRGEGMVYTKLVDESMGPYEKDAPIQILDLLSDPPVNEWAANWRAESRRRAEAKKAMPVVRKGDTVRLSKPIKFTNGLEADTFQFERDYTFRAGGVRVSLPKDWKTRYEWTKEEVMT